MSALGTDSLERQKDVHITRQLSAELDRHAARDGVDLECLVLVKGRGTDERVDLLRRDAAHLFRCSRPREQPPRRWQRDLIIGANGNDAGDELLEDRAESVLSKLEH